MRGMWISAYLWILVLIVIWAILVVWRWKQVQSGLDSDPPPRIHVAIEALPKFDYVKGEEGGGGTVKCRGVVECSICLGFFLEGETLRLIPSCRHVFHAECVDRWLISNPTCPCCRTNVVPHSTQPEPCRDDPDPLSIV